MKFDHEESDLNLAMRISGDRAREIRRDLIEHYLVNPDDTISSEMQYVNETYADNELAYAFVLLGNLIKKTRCVDAT